MTAVEHLPATSQQTEIQRPRMYSVVFLNDDFTPMDFVTIVLMDIFGLNLVKAEKLMIEIHRAGRGVAGIFTREIAETKADLVARLAQQEGHPLLCQVETASD